MVARIPEMVFPNPATTVVFHVAGKKNCKIHGDAVIILGVNCFNLNKMLVSV